MKTHTTKNNTIFTPMGGGFWHVQRDGRFLGSLQTYDGLLARIKVGEVTLQFQTFEEAAAFFN